MMKKLLKFRPIMAILLLTLIAVSCVPPEHREAGGPMGDNAIQEALAEKIKQGGSMKDVLPPTSVMVVGTLIPIAGTIGLFIVLYFIATQYHRRTMKMIEKGTYSPQKKNIRLDLISMFIGLISLFSGLGISLWMLSRYGMHAWSLMSGIIPICVGAGFVIFGKLLKDNLTK